MKKNEFSVHGLYQHVQIERIDRRLYRVTRLFSCVAIHGNGTNGRTIEFKEVGGDNEEHLKGVERLNLMGERVCMATRFNPTRENGDTYLINAMYEIE